MQQQQRTIRGMSFLRPDMVPTAAASTCRTQGGSAGKSGGGSSSGGSGGGSRRRHCPALHAGTECVQQAAPFTTVCSVGLCAKSCRLAGSEELPLA